MLELFRVGGGCPDLLVYRPRDGTLHLVEVKTAKGHLTDDQQRFHDEWPVWVVRGVDDVVRLFVQ